MAIKYSLKKLGGRAKGTSVQLTQIHGGLGAERAYVAELRRMLKALALAVGRDIVPVAAREMKAPTVSGPTVDAMVQDVGREFFEQLKQLANGLANISIVNIEKILRLEGKRHTKSFISSVKAAIGIDVSVMVAEEDLEGVMDNAVTRSVGLIKGLGETVTTRLQTTITNAVTNSIGVAELKKQLKDDFGFADSRAKLIARDQIATVNAELNRYRHEQAGIKQYVWRTSRDERVRPRHARLNGKTYTYGEPTGAESGLPPGQPIQCRCIAQAVVEF